MSGFKNTLGIVANVATMVSGLCGVLGTGVDLGERIRQQ